MNTKSILFELSGNKERAALKLPFPADWRQLMCRNRSP
nr:MAG TPA: hypothetical protein [Caudoviricetes sp.]